MIMGVSVRAVLRIALKYAPRAFIHIKHEPDDADLKGIVTVRGYMPPWSSFRLSIQESRLCILDEILRDGNYIEYLSQIRRALLRRRRAGEGRPTICDIGAHVGIFPVVFNHFLGEFQPRFLCFEPFPENFALLSKNIRQNAIDAEADPHAISNRAGDETLYLISPIGATISREEMLVYCSQKGRDQCEINTARVKIDTLDALLAERGIDSVDLVKMDCEGSESEALEGMERTLLESEPMLIVSYEHYVNDPTQLASLITRTNPRYRIARDERRKNLLATCD